MKANVAASLDLLDGAFLAEGGVDTSRRTPSSNCHVNRESSNCQRIELNFIHVKSELAVAFELRFWIFRVSNWNRRKFGLSSPGKKVPDIVPLEYVALLT